MVWVKLNSDGAVTLDEYASFGGMLQFSNAKWLWGYAMRIDDDSIFKVEARGMLEGCISCMRQRLQKNEVESDNALLVELLHLGGGINSNLVEVRLLHQTLRRDWETRVWHISRNANTIADAMAKHTSLGDSMLNLFQGPSVLIRRFLRDDNYGTSDISIQTVSCNRLRTVYFYQKKLLFKILILFMYIF